MLVAKPNTDYGAGDLSGDGHAEGVLGAGMSGKPHSGRTHLFGAPSL